MSTVSIIVPVHRAGRLFQQCLEALLNTTPAPQEIIIVPDGESDFEWEKIRDLGVVVLNPTLSPKGPAHARNRGAAAATSDILFFTDADVIVPSDTIQQINTQFAAHPGYDALIGSYDDQPGQQNFLSQYRNLLHHYVHQISSFDASTFWGACGAIRRSAFHEIGGFDERFAKPSIEDIELGYRLRRSGRMIMLCKTLQVKHLKYWNARSIIHTDFFQRALPWTRLILQEKVFHNDLNLRYSHRISVGLVFILAASLIGSVFLPQILIFSVLIALILFSLNRDVYSFFLRKRGWFFLLQVVPWHWIYYSYSGLAFIIGSVQHIVRPESTHQERNFGRRSDYEPDFHGTKRTESKRR